MQSLIYPAQSLKIDLKNPQIDVTDDQFHKLTLYTDGRLLPRNSDINDQEVDAHWNGNRLVSDERSPLGGNMSRTFELSADGRQLYESLQIDNGRSRNPINIRYVYDVNDPGAQSRQADRDPNRPVLKRSPDSDAASAPQPDDSDPNRPVLKRSPQDSTSPSQ